MRHSRHIAALLVVILALIVAGCGGGDEDASAVSDPGTNTNGSTVGNQTPATTPTTPGATGAAAVPGAAGAGATAATAGGGLSFPTDDSGTDLGAVSEILDPIGKNDKGVFGPLVNTDPTTTTTDTTATTATTDTTAAAVDTTPAVTYSYGPATINLNGTKMTVAEGGVFPSDSQFFTLREINPTSVTIDLTSGQFGNGAQGFFLRVGKSRTVENENEGEEFVIKLVSIKKEANTTNG